MISHLDKIINSAGLICDVIGAWLVAWEVVKQFHGSKFHSLPLAHIPGVPPVTENPKYAEYEKQKYYKMKIGLAFLTFGFLLQLLSNWVVCIIKSIQS